MQIKCNGENVVFRREIVEDGEAHFLEWTFDGDGEEVELLLSNAGQQALRSAIEIAC